MDSGMFSSGGSPYSPSYLSSPLNKLESSDEKKQGRLKREGSLFFTLKRKTNPSVFGMF